MVEQNVVARLRGNVRRPRFQNALQAFQEQTGYANFGSIIGRRSYARPETLPLIASWMSQHSSGSVTNESFAKLLTVCEDRNPSWFLTATAITLHQQSRSMTKGVYIFHAISNFSQIPGAAVPAAVSSGYTAAIFDHPDREFMYLEPLWRQADDGKLTPTTATEFKGLLEAQRAQILRMIPRIRIRRVVRGCANAVGTVVGALLSIVLAVVFLVFQIVPGISYLIRRLAETKELMALESTGRYGARRFEPIGLWEAAHTLATPISTRRLEKLVYRWDPMIVFKVPELAHRFDGDIPLGLVAHWD